MYPFPSHFPISVSWITNILLWAELWVQWDSHQGSVIVRAAPAPGSVGAPAGEDVCWDRHQSSWRSFLFCCLYFWSSVWLPSVGKDLSVSENRLRQCLSLKWTLVNLLVICKIAVAMPTRGPVKKLWVTQSLDLVLCCLQGCSVVGR